MIREASIEVRTRIRIPVSTWRLATQWGVSRPEVPLDVTRPVTSGQTGLLCLCLGIFEYFSIEEVLHEVYSLVHF